MAGKSTGLRAATIFASLSLSTEDFAKGLNKALGDLEKFSAKVESVGNKLGGVGALMAASLGASVAVAASQVAPLGDALERMKSSGQALANEIGAQLVPTVEAMARAVGSATRFVQSLDDDVKRVLASMAVWTTGGLLAAGMAGKLAGAVAGLSQAFQLVLKHSQPAFKAIDAGFGALRVKGLVALAPVLAIAAGLATIVLAAGAVYRAWNDTSTGFADAVKSIVSRIMEWVRAIGRFIADVFDGIVSFIGESFRFMANQMAAMIRFIAKTLEPVAGMLGMDGARSFLEDAKGFTGERFIANALRGADALKDGVLFAGKVIADVGKSIGGDIATSVKYAAGGVEDMFGGVIAKVKGLFGDLTGGSATQRTRYEYDVGAVAKVGLGANIGEQLTKGASATMLAFRKMNEAAWKEEVAVRLDVARWQTEQTERAAQAIRAAYDGLVDRFVSRTGEIASLAESAMQGAQAGGIWGAIAAVAVDLLSRSEQFKVFADQLNALIQQVSNTLGKVLAPVFAALTPILDVVADTTAALEPILQAFGDVIGGVLGPILKVVGSVIIGITRFIGMVWNTIIDIVASVVSIFNEDAANDLRRRKMDMRALDEAERRLWAEREMADAAESIAAKLGDSDNNIPSGWRRNLATYRSMDEGPVGMAPGGGGGGGTTIIIGEVSGANALEIADQIGDALTMRRERIAIKKSGTRIPRGSMYGNDLP